MDAAGNLSNIKMMLFIILEFLLLILKVLYYICEEVYRLFVSREKKSVTGEVVLVCSIFAIHVSSHDASVDLYSHKEKYLIYI